MGKLKKRDVASGFSKQGDEKQTKISSFFGNKLQTGRKESALFTKISTDRVLSKNDTGQQSSLQSENHTKRQESKSGVLQTTVCIKERKETNDDEVVIVSCENFQENGTKRAENMSSLSKEIKKKERQGVCLKHSTKVPEDLVSTKAKSKESVFQIVELESEAQVSEPAIADCVFATPDKKIQTTIDSSPDIICDTPGIDLELERSKTRRRQLYASRSFLCSSDRVSVQPGLKPAHLRAQKKVRPSKLLGKVSVSFNKSKSESNSTSSSSDVADVLQQNQGATSSKPLSSLLCDTGRENITQEPSCHVPEKSCSIPETQIEERPCIESSRVGSKIEQYLCDEEEPEDCHVFNQSSHELDKTVDKYMDAMENLESADMETDKLDQSYPCGRQLDEFSGKSLSWDRTEAKADKISLVNRKLSDDENLKNLNLKSKLLGALNAAEVRAIKEEKGKAQLKDRRMSDALQHESSSRLKDKETTPIKIYPGETLKIKRLAKTGESPMSKRTHSADYPSEESTFSGNSDINSVTSRIKKVLSFDSHSAKLSIKRCHKFTRQRAVEFGLKPKEKVTKADEKISLKDDRVLADLLVDLNSSGDNSKLDKVKDFAKVGKTELFFEKGHRKSTSQKIRTFTEAKITNDDKKILNALFEDTVVDIDEDLQNKSEFTSLPKSNVDDPQEPILIEDSENPSVEESEVCFVVEKEFDDIENFLENMQVQGGEKDICECSKLKKVAATDLTKGEVRKVKSDSEVELPFVEQCFESARLEKNSGPVMSDLIKETDPAENSCNTLFNIFSQDNARFSRIKSNSAFHGSKPNASGCKEDQLSSSVCELLSESFDKEFVVPQLPTSQETAKKKIDFVFTDLWNRFYVTDKNYHRESDELVLDLTCSRSHVTKQCALKGFWVDTEVKTGDIVNVVAELEEGRYIVDDKKGLIVVNPDILLSGTLVVSAVFCPRKSVLNEQFKGVDKGNVQMLYGSIIHSLFQEVLKNGVFLEKDVEKIAMSRLKSSKFLHEMYGQNLEESTVMEEVKQYIPTLIDWLCKHTFISNNCLKAVRSERKPNVMVTEIQDIEENLWSPRFGLKGKIDMTVKAKVGKADSSLEEKVLPLELKTGKASFSSEHKGQVQLYSMMCSDRRADPQEGILLYLKQGQMETVPVKPESKSGLIQLRNKLAKDLSRQVVVEKDEFGNSTYLLGNLPKPINKESACSKCAHLQTCSIYQRSVEKVERPAGHAMSTLVPQALAHLGDEDLAYFLHWVLCLDVEGQESGRRQLQQIWCSSSWQREKDGECLSNLVITGSELGILESQSFNEGQGCSLSFSRHSDCQGPPLNSVGLTSGDMVVLSSEDGRLIALATGFVRNISASTVKIVVDRDYLHNTAAYQGLKFRLDRNSSFSTSGYLYTNLARLMNPDPQGLWLRELIIKQRAPEFELKVSKANLYKVKSIFKPLNRPQRTAILKVLMAKDYVLIKGYPGTGKTSTIVALVKILYLLGLSVLLTSYTHSAVDNILLKLKMDEVPFVRLGRQGRIHPSILPYSAEVLTSSPRMDSVQSLKEFYGSYSIVATSCLGVSNHPVFSQRHFDVCIVDEASQVLQPACLAPLFHCRKFVLVGDPKQLPPVVQSKEAKKLGMDVSLFAHLDNRGATYDLSLQYRMNRVIMDLSNKLVYGGKLECGDPSVAEQCLKMDPSAMENQSQWMKAALSSQLQNSVVFIDTQQICAPEIQDGKGLKNVTEAHIVLSLLQTLIHGQVSGESIGVISPYRSQVRLLQHMVAECSNVADVEVNTVDQYQGRDKGVIVVSFVRSQTENEGELLKDLRRLNVALTRAKYKLLLVGNSSALQIYENLASLLDWLRQSQNIVTIQENYIPNS